MSASVSATRMNLLMLKNQANLARQGVELLKRKRDALVLEFFKIVKQTLLSREELTQVMAKAYEDLNLVKAVEGSGSAHSTAMAGARSIMLEDTLKNVWGVKIPEFTEKKFIRNALERGGSPAALSTRMQETAVRFEQLAELLVKIASIEVRLKRMGFEIKKTTRRVNALEQIILPTINIQVRYIRSVIEQREREDIFRLKKIKLKLLKKKADSPHA